jgi:hypothetical protein
MTQNVQKIYISYSLICLYISYSYMKNQSGELLPVNHLSAVFKYSFCVGLTYRS